MGTVSPVYPDQEAQRQVHIDAQNAFNQGVADAASAPKTAGTEFDLVSYPESRSCSYQEHSCKNAWTVRWLVVVGRARGYFPSRSRVTDPMDVGEAIDDATFIQESLDELLTKIMDAWAGSDNEAVWLWGAVLISLFVMSIH